MTTTPTFTRLSLNPDGKATYRFSGLFPVETLSFDLNTVWTTHAEDLQVRTWCKSLITAEVDIPIQVKDGMYDSEAMLALVLTEMARLRAAAAANAEALIAFLQPPSAPVQVEMNFDASAEGGVVV